MIVKDHLAVREASHQDRQHLANLIHFENRVHRHLDWRPPLDWIGSQPYLVAERDNSLVAALACPPEPPGAAWIRLFATASTVNPEESWGSLWSLASSQLAETNNRIVAAIPLLEWFRKLLQGSGFYQSNTVIMLEWANQKLPAGTDGSAMIRPMNLDDLPTIEELDAAAFGTIWQNSLSSLELAFRQAAIATVTEEHERIVGYQISTTNQMGGHLARLATHPQYQRRGIGYALLIDLLHQFSRRGARRVTVNTQEDNLASLALYKKAGFTQTGEDFPVYQCLL